MGPFFTFHTLHAPSKGIITMLTDKHNRCECVVVLLYVVAADWFNAKESCCPWRWEIPTRKAQKEE